MAEWCRNRFEITGKSVCLDVLTQWIEGCETPRYRHAIQQSIQLFLIGCAGLVKPTRTTQYPPYPALVRHGTGMSSPANQAFEQWLGLLVKDAVLDEETIKTIDRLYHQSCIGAVRWGNLPDNAREIITTLMHCQYSDWFGLVGLSEHIDAEACWSRLSDYPEQAQPCDMLMVIPPRLATELNGSGGLLQGISTTTSLYSRIYGVEWPSGHNVRWVRDEMSSLVRWLVKSRRCSTVRYGTGTANLSGAYRVTTVMTVVNIRTVTRRPNGRGGKNFHSPGCIWWRSALKNRQKPRLYRFRWLQASN